MNQPTSTDTDCQCEYCQFNWISDLIDQHPIGRPMSRTLLPTDIDTLEIIARGAEKHGPRFDYAEAFRPERVLALLAVVRAAKEADACLRTALAAFDALEP